MPRAVSFSGSFVAGLVIKFARIMHANYASSARRRCFRARYNE